MSNKDDGGPAFPLPGERGDRMAGRVEVDGMTMRDYFAAHALQGLLASRIAAERGHNHADVAEIAYANADAMLEARK